MIIKLAIKIIFIIKEDKSIGKINKKVGGCSDM
jgi:hypothetical protein